MIPKTHQPQQNLWQRAANFAARAHRHQTRKDGETPYVAHTYRVALTCRHVFECADETVLAAALLHDTIEDTGIDYDDICEEFGKDVADAVAALTKNMILPETEREKEYDERLARASWQARMIKLADTYDNLADSINNPEYPKPVGSRIHKAHRALELAENDSQAVLAREKLRELIRTFQVAQGNIA